MANTKIHTILQCFVDLNLETDENSQYFLKLPKVSFEKSSYSIVEGETVSVKISLEAPSEAGLEEVELGLVINNTSASDFTTLGESYPKTLIFSAGEQTKIFKFQATTDLIENEVESFDLILGFFTNTIPGQFITTKINIIDETNLKEVSINEQGGSIIPGITDGVTSIPPSLNFSVLEGSAKNVTVSLSSPSVLGIESVDVEFTNITTSAADHNSTGVIPLTWAVGEQNKIINVESNQDEDIEGDETLQIKLVNPTNVNIVSFSEAKMKILDAAPAARYATANFQGLYIQKAKAGQNVEARYIRRNTITDIQDTTWRMFIRFGDYIEQNYLTFNPPSTIPSAPVCGEGCISGYNPFALPAFQQNNKMFFGKNPESQAYGDVRLRIKNMGSHPCNISGTTVAVNDSITITIDKFDYKIKLPANDVLLSAGTFFGGSPLSNDTLVECNYGFTFEIDYDGINFQLREWDNTVSSNKEFNLGVHRFDTTFTSSDADLPSNFYNLVTEYSNVWPYWESDFVWPHTSPYCLLPGNIITQDPPYPTDTGDLQDIKVDGIMFLHQDTANQTSPSSTKTQYIGFEFLTNGQKVSDSGCTSVNIQYSGGAFPPVLQTSSIPFKVV